MATSAEPLVSVIVLMAVMAVAEACMEFCGDDYNDQNSAAVNGVAFVHCKLPN